MLNGQRALQNYICGQFVARHRSWDLGELDTLMPDRIVRKRDILDPWAVPTDQP